MKRCFVFCLLLMAVISCQSFSRKVGEEPSNAALTNNSTNEANDLNTFSELVESFSDDSQIAQPHKNKVELFNYAISDEQTRRNSVVIKFYRLSPNGNWDLRQTLEFEKDDIGSIEPKFEDFNNDGLKDLTYISDHPARGANESRSLFIYDRIKDELQYIENSSDYPNLQYNKKLNCLDAWAFHGGVTTIFAKIKGNKLVTFATVDHRDNNRTISVYDEKGIKKVIRKDKILNDDFFSRYETFNPPTFSVKAK